MKINKQLLQILQNLGMEKDWAPKDTSQWQDFLKSLNEFFDRVEVDQDLMEKSLAANNETIQAGIRKSDGLEEYLLETEAELKALIASSPLGLFLSDPSGNISFVNKRFCEITGFDSQESFKRDWVDTIHADDRAEFQARWKTMRDDPSEPFDWELRFVNPINGQNNWCHVKVAAIVAGTNVRGFFGTIDDITERKQAESLLVGEKQVLEMIARNLSQRYILESILQLIENQGIPLRGSIFEVAGNGENLIQAAAINLPELLIQAHKTLPLKKVDLEKSLLNHDENALQTLNGEWETYVVAAKKYGFSKCFGFPITDSRSELIGVLVLHCEENPPTEQHLETIGFFNDLISISIERKYIQEKLENEQMKMIASSKMASLGEMAGGIAHEIMNPIAIIDGFAMRLEKIANKGKLDAESVVSHVGKIRSTVARITKIINSLRTFARDGEKELFVATKINDVIEETLEFCRQKLNYRAIKLKRGVTDDSLTIDCRSIQISQVLLNLLNNAADAVDSLEEKWIEITVKDLSEQVEIRVVDSGKGIRPDLADKIMKPYFTTKPIGKGTGLGLSLSKTIAENHGGKLWIDFSCKNTCFVVELPKRHRKAA